MLMTKGESRAGLAFAIGLLALAADWLSFIALELPLPASQAVEVLVKAEGPEFMLTYQPVRDLMLRCGRSETCLDVQLEQCHVVIQIDVGTLGCRGICRGVCSRTAPRLRQPADYLPYT